MAFTLEKLREIRSDLTITNPEWESWDFVKLVEALHCWTRRDQINQSNEKRRCTSGKLNYLREQDKPRGCVHCEYKSHKSSECTKATTVSFKSTIYMLQLHREKPQGG